MAHTEFGFQVIEKFLAEINAYGHPDFAAKLIGRGINVMISPLPRNKRAKHPAQLDGGAPPPATATARETAPEPPTPAKGSDDSKAPGFANNPFVQLEVNR
jgi:translation initiation factor IF-3